MNTTEMFLIGMVAIFSLPYLFWRLLRTDYYAPLVVVQIVGGILMGPGVFGALFPEAHGFIFKPEVITALNGIALWAVMLFVWVAGIELDLQQAWKNRGETILTSGLALITPLMFGSAAAWLLLGTGDWVGSNGSSLQAILGIGMACAVTALPILVLLLEKLEILRQPIGQRVLRYASLDDVAIWAVLALILLEWERVGQQFGFLVVFVIASIGMRRLMVRLLENDRWYVGLIWLAVCSFAADWAGLHFMVGAFLSGVVLDAQWFGQNRLDAFRNSVLLAIMPVFFLSTGLRTSWDVGGIEVFGAAVVFLVASVSGKLAGVHLAGRLLKWGPGEATIIGWLLQTKALIMIIFVNILLDKKIITGETFTALLIMALASTMLTTPIVGPRLAKARGLIAKEN